MTEFMTYTYQARIDLHSALQDYADLYNLVKHKLYAQIQTGQNPDKLKSSFLHKYGITGRQFNAISVDVKGKISFTKEMKKVQDKDNERRIKACKARIKKQEDPFKIHNMQRRVSGLKQHIILEPRSVCFGSRKLFRSQFNEGQDFSTWKAAWQRARSNEFYVLGSHEETSGCQGCVATVQDDGSLSLRLRLPDSLASKHGKWIVINNVRFPYGHERIVNALLVGDTPISYRFKVDEKGWRVFATVHVPQAKVTSHWGIGVIGIDLNVDHVALAETDRFGNLVYSTTYPLETAGLSTHQTLALLGDRIKEIVAYAKQQEKPIVIEDLEFDKKRCELRGRGQTANKLSSFCYSKFQSMVASRCHREGVKLGRVNPAYTSVIGKHKFAERYGLSVHQAAAFSIARRFQGFTEEPNPSTHVTLAVPVRKRFRHVWTYWAQLSKATRDRTSRPSGVDHHNQSGVGSKPNSGPIRNRYQNCSGSVVDKYNVLSGTG